MAKLPMDLVSVLERRIERLEERVKERERIEQGAGCCPRGRINELQRTISLIKASINEGEMTLKGVDAV